ncbi:MAG: Acyl-[acyl-carrier-protein]--UDP-N-acetylglucosamine O-acyltransferase [Ignavibacteria bacterium]|nr:Acyl-[acyl-carrier-protein]--UDP-N-acetylglucosamine O-acyltransferase [Ignavibacteria bacterium]
MENSQGTLIHSTAIVSPNAIIGTGVTIGAFTIIEDNVEIGDGTQIRSNAVIASGARIGKDCRIYNGAVIGTEPQDLKFKGCNSVAIIGDRTVIREYVTVNRGTEATLKTCIGEDCFVMAYAHIAHDCHLGSNIIVSNVTQFAGHCEVEDWVIFGGVVKVHQFSKIGCHSMIGADVKIAKDIAPYLMIGTNPPKVDGMNVIGLRRRGFSKEIIQQLDKFYTMIFHSGMNITDGIARFTSDTSEISKEVQHCIDFIGKSDRGIYR